MPLLLALFLFFPSVARAQVEAELTAWAVEDIRIRAEHGFPSDQFALGEMYFTGRGTLFQQFFTFGVRQNYAEAAKWYRRAAEQGNVLAQIRLGWLCERGDGVKQDYAEAYFWFSLAASKSPSFAHKPGAVVKKLTSEQVAAVKKSVAEWKPKPEWTSPPSKN